MVIIEVLGMHSLIDISLIHNDTKKKSASLFFSANVSKNKSGVDNCPDRFSDNVSLSINSMTSVFITSDSYQ